MQPNTTRAFAPLSMTCTVHHAETTSHATAETATSRFHPLPAPRCDEASCQVLDRAAAVLSSASHGSRTVPATPSSRPAPAPRLHRLPCADTLISERHPAPSVCRYNGSGRPSCVRFVASRPVSAPHPPCFCHVRIPEPQACACISVHHASGAMCPTAAIARSS